MSKYVIEINKNNLPIELIEGISRDAIKECAVYILRDGRFNVYSDSFDYEEDDDSPKFEIDNLIDDFIGCYKEDHLVMHNLIKIFERNLWKLRSELP